MGVQRTTKNIQLISKALHFPMVLPPFRKPPSPARVLAGLFICLALSFPLGVEAGEKERKEVQKQVQKQEQGKPDWELPSHIQLRPIMAPITGASQFYAPITLYLQAVSKDHIQKICRYRPRIFDAVQQFLSHHPIPVIQRKLDLSHFPAQILAPINRALGAEIVWAVHVAPGAISMGYNNGLFTFASSGCKIIEEHEATLKKAAAAKESH